jgi:hypothetical protein
VSERKVILTLIIILLHLIFKTKILGEVVVLGGICDVAIDLSYFWQNLRFQKHA